MVINLINALLVIKKKIKVALPCWEGGKTAATVSQKAAKPEQGLPYESEQE
jgi:hypothetical protein